MRNMGNCCRSNAMIMIDPETMSTLKRNNPEFELPESEKELLT